MTARSTETAVPRRRGSRDSDTRAKILDATAALLLDEGYAAITARRIGESAGVNYQLVHYYFESMDALFIELFRQGAEQNLAHLEELAREQISLRTFWKITSDANGGRLMTEFVALSNHRPALKREIARYARRFRTAQLALAERALAADRVEVVPPVVITLLTLGLGQLIALDRAIGVTDGHAEAAAWIEQWLDANDDSRPDPS